MNINNTVAKRPRKGNKETTLTIDNSSSSQCGEVMKKNLDLVKLVQERWKVKEAEEIERKKLEEEAYQPALSEDCVSLILFRLPVESLLRSSCVCTRWNSIIHRPSLVQTHASRSESVLVFEASHEKGSTTTEFSVEESLVIKSEPNNLFNRQKLERLPKNFIHFVELTEEEGEIRNFNISCRGKVLATCNGLMLLQNKLKIGGLLLMNPVTRKLVNLPGGTLVVTGKESYGLMFDPDKSEYKVVHLFIEELTSEESGYIQQQQQPSVTSGYISCEILSVTSKSWKMVDGPDRGMISWFRFKPVFAIGALHWLPHKLHNDYIVSLETGTEKFRTVELPKSGGLNDRIIEMAGVLCFATHEEENKMDIWVLTNLSEENWVRVHTISAFDFALDMIPLSGSRFCERIVFTREEDGALYIYVSHVKSITKIDMRGWTGRVWEDSYLTHVNTLATWEKSASE